MKRIDWNGLGDADRCRALARPEKRADEQLRERVRNIVNDVRARGWQALSEIALELDGQEPRRVEVRTMASAARRRLDPQQVEAVEFAAAQIRKFHRASVPSDFSLETAPGLVVTKTWRPIDRVGLYVPGGKTPLFSSLLMLAIPARAAGVRQIVTITPPRPGGGLDDLVALAADLAGIDEVWTVGGAQAIAALAFGAGAIPAVDKICGPGNAWVAEAKRLVMSMPGGPAIDLPAGPSELLVIADESSDPRLVAADLLSQAEHDPDAQVLLVTPSVAVATAVEAEISERVRTLPRREIVEASLGSCRVILVADLHEAIEVANLYAPEHLSLAVEPAQALVAKIRSAGAVFAGPHAAETFGDYLAGSSHVLPTDGAARAWSGISVYTFLKAMSVQAVTREGAESLSRRAALLARMESLEAHALAADARLELMA
ncbi:histidinol dehydrogenase [Sphingomonas daechungensis]|uniref:histidinol dehydrogenase n=1 Tax=Sphingomonas daechungensis TaxID=1176646 RepID=UPI0031EEA211